MKKIKEFKYNINDLNKDIFKTKFSKILKKLNQKELMTYSKYCIIKTNLSEYILLIKDNEFNNNIADCLLFPLNKKGNINNHYKEETIRNILYTISVHIKKIILAYNYNLLFFTNIIEYNKLIIITSKKILDKLNIEYASYLDRVLLFNLPFACDYSMDLLLIVDNNKIIMI